MTNGHVSDELPRLLTGDTTRDEAMAAAQHLRSCPDCQQELVSAVVAHAALTSARRFAPEVVTSGEPADAEHAPPAPLPDMSAVFAKARDETHAPKHGGRRGRVIAVAAAAVVATAAGVTIAETVGSGPSHPSGQTIELAAFGVGRNSAEATITDTGAMRIDATSLPKPARGQFYEVWLTDPARKHLQAVGAIGGDNTAQLTIPLNVMAEYSAVEVSVQKVNQTSYSGTSVLRGSY